MAAGHSLPEPSTSRKSLISCTGVLTISGFGVRVKMQNGHLHIEDGVGLDRRTFKLPRVNHGLKRLVCISEDGLVTLSALKWLADTGASFVILNRSGKVLFATGPAGSSDARLRRAQALALGNSVGLELCRALIHAKLEGQERVARELLNDAATRKVIASYRERLWEAATTEAVRSLESNAAASYFAALRSVPVLWPKADLPIIPAHWKTVGTRQSPLSGGPRLAVTPVHAILNYCFALLEAESRLALAALGLDPGLGVGLHTDTANRDSLALDVLEPVRPQVETWLLHWISREPLRRADFFETEIGNCRIRSQLCSYLGQTAPVWGKLVAPWAEFVASTLAAGTHPRSIVTADDKLPTRLTQRHRRDVKGKLWLSTVEPPGPERRCRGCGKPIRKEGINCADCAIPDSTKRLVKVARLGRVAGHSPEALAKEGETQRRHAKARSAWDPSSQPAWLTPEFYVHKIQPLIAQISSSVIARCIGVSRWYAGRIREGYCPHPRHWQVLAEIVGISAGGKR